MQLLHAFLLSILFSFSAFGQENKENSYEFHINLAEKLNRSYRFDESILELQKAISIAKSNKNEYQIINAEISLAELMRRTQNYIKGYEILSVPKNYKSYPDLYVRKLGRLSAIFAEGKFYEKLSLTEEDFNDSIKSFLNKALIIAVKEKLKVQEAGLQNELGLFIMRTQSRAKANYHLQRSADLFLELKDMNNYVRPMIFIMENHLADSNFSKFDSIANKLLKFTKGKKWYSPEADLFKMIGRRCLLVGDSLGYFNWREKASLNNLAYLKTIYNEKMVSYEVRYETEKLKKQALKSDLLAIEKTKNFEKLSYTFLVFILIIIVAIFFFLREIVLKRKLKKLNLDLNVSNKKYQLLMVESNHRIKNNLQMIISMVDYFKEDLNKNDINIANRISGKIQTISTLHKHLSLDVHNELVDISVYFSEILKLYGNLYNNFKVDTELDFIKISSETIIYYGLILNEMLLNTIEHNTSLEKNITIEVTKKNGKCTFSYCDNSNLETTSEHGIGTKLISQLITRVKGENFIIDKPTGLYKFNFYA
jgi:two-component sensor histidine kinase